MGRAVETFHGYAGQSEIVRSLRRHCEGIAAKGMVMPNIGIFGGSGLGKTMLASAIASELQVNFLDFYCSAAVKRHQLARHLLKAKKGDVVFLDECHLIPDPVQTLLYRALDSWRVPVVDEHNRIAENEFQNCEPFCLILATDQPSLLNKALSRRIVLPYTIGEYSTAEMRLIVMNYASCRGVLLSLQAATRLAEAGRGVPRRARFLLESLRACMPDTDVPVSRTAVNKHLAEQGIDTDNLTGQDRTYLAALARRGSHMSLSDLAIIVGTDEPTIAQSVEPYLLQKSLVAKEPRGRILTEAGKKYVADRRLA
jgi:Holliday junction DNA helicase RuvB